MTCARCKGEGGWVAMLEDGDEDFVPCPDCGGRGFREGGEGVQPTIDHAPLSEPEPFDVEIAWAAGLFEGEGSIIHYRRSDRPETVRCLSLQMTDEDVVRRFVRIVGRGPVRAFPGADETRKPTWQWKLDHWDDIEPVLILLLPFLGKRRRVKAEGLLADPAAPRKRIHPEQTRMEGFDVNRESFDVGWERMERASEDELRRMERT